MPTNKRQENPPPPAQDERVKNLQSQRRRYISTKRREQVAETEERIIAAGAELVHQLPTWDWTNITAPEVGKRADLSERTVYRYFPTERKLRDAVIQRMICEAGVSFEGLTLSGFTNITQIMFSYLMSFAAQPLTTPVTEPTLASMDQIRCETLLNAVVKATPDWSASEQENMAAALDIFWNLPPYERLIQIWGFDAQRAIATMTWLIDLVIESIQQGRRPELNI